MYIAAMNIKSCKKTYKKGDVLGNEFSKEDISRFIKMGAVFSRGEERLTAEEFDDYEPEEIVFFDESDLRKIKSKAELREYGKRIGFEASMELTREEIINSLLNYIEEARETGEC